MSQATRKESIFKKALLLLNIRYSQIKENMTEGDSPVELEYCEEFFDAAVTYCASLRYWSFLISHEEFSPGDRVEGSYRGYDYAYPLPYDMLKPYIVDGEFNVSFAIDSENIYFDHEVSNIDYTIDGFSQMSNAPLTFDSLIAARLAVELAPCLAPDSNIVQRCAQNFQLALASALEAEVSKRREETPRPEEYII